MLDQHESMNFMGTGLGLSISYQLAKMMGCKLKVKSILNGGSTFYLLINFRDDENEQKRGHEIFKRLQSRKLVNQKSLFSEDKAKQNNSFTSFAKETPKTTENRQIVLKTDQQRHFNKYLKNGEETINLCRLVNASQVKEKEFIFENPIRSTKTESESDCSESSVESVKTVKMPLNCSHISNLSVLQQISRNSIPFTFNEININNEAYCKKEKIIIHDDNIAFIKTPNKILIIEDNIILIDSLINLIEKILRKHCISDYVLVKAYDGVDLIKLIVEDQKHKNSIKLVIVDEHMEYMNGSEAIAILRNLEIQNKIKPILIVKFTCDQNVINNNKTVYLNKPANKGDITQVLKIAQIIKN